MAEEIKYRLTIRAGDQEAQLGATNQEDFMLLTGLSEVSAAAVADYLQKLANKLGKLPTAIIKEAPAGCLHKRTKQISGQGQKGPWQGLKCLDCGQANFKNRSRDGGAFWSGWKAAKSTARRDDYPPPDDLPPEPIEDDLGGEELPF